MNFYNFRSIPRRDNDHHSTAMRNDPTHPPGFCKVHRYAKEWNGLLIRGCFAQGLSLTISLAISKKSLSLYIYILCFTLTIDKLNQ
jgi:hypothetical protein